MKFNIVISLGLVFVLLVSGCTTRAQKVASWPSDIPSRAFFVEHYEADADNKNVQEVENYLLWVLRFYKGWELYSNGWSKVTEDSLHGVTNPVLADEIRTKMNFIGKDIACEWAKNKKDRRILTRHVVVWGNALIESIRRDKELALINRVLADVNGLLVNQVAMEDVKAERYFPRDGDDVFM